MIPEVKSRGFLKGEVTGLSNPRCVFENHKDCSNKISREHYFSEAILKQLNWDGLTFTGFPWASKPSVKSMTAKFLCERHNNALGFLDASASHFFSEVRRAVTLSTLDTSFHVSGKFFELWMLKVFVGAIKAKIVQSFNTVAPKNVSLPQDLLDILSGFMPFKDGMGMYLLGIDEYTGEKLGFTPVFYKNNQHKEFLCGCDINIAGMNFRLVTDRRVIVPSGSVYRPKLIYMQSAFFDRRTLHLQW